ncbi:hypothetical protein [Pontibacter sp. HJ8]
MEKSESAGDPDQPAVPESEAEQGLRPALLPSVIVKMAAKAALLLRIALYFVKSSGSAK